MRACMAAAVSGDPGAIHGMLAELTSSRAATPSASPAGS